MKSFIGSYVCGVARAGNPDGLGTLRNLLATDAAKENLRIFEKPFPRPPFAEPGVGGPAAILPLVNRAMNDVLAEFILPASAAGEGAGMVRAVRWNEQERAVFGLLKSILEDMCVAMWGVPPQAGAA
jgi:hypothetical protein